MASFSDHSSKFDLILCFMLVACVTNVWCRPAPGVISVKDHGARGDGVADDTKALMAAWTAACGAPTKTKLVVPVGTYLAPGLLNFQGQCKNPVEFQLDGTIKAPSDMFGTEDWVVFKYVNGLTLSGKGAFDGSGAQTWKENQCNKKDQGGKCKFPINLRFNFVNDAVINDISSIDSKVFHINVFGCKNVKFNNVKVTAPGTSVNTDGIHIADSTDVEILGATIATGDDCISIGNGTQNLHISGASCGPGHGISIGSLGKADSDETVSGVHVQNCSFKGTDNGVRIKTWPAGTPGKVFNCTFEDLTMDNVQFPIVIDQEYCPYAACDKSKPSQVKITDIRFKNIHGTSSTKDAISLVCGLPCDGVHLEGIDLKNTGTDGPASSKCANIKPTLGPNIVPAACTAPAAPGAGAGAGADPAAGKGPGAGADPAAGAGAGKAPGGTAAA